MKRLQRIGKREVLALVLLASTTSGSAEPAGAHDTLFVLDQKIGTPIDGKTGFTCTKETRTASGEREDRHCVKFVDDRCKGPGKLGAKRYGEKAPRGCYFDYSTQGTYLDDLLMQDSHSGDTSQPHNGRKPLAHVHLVGTESTPSMVYRIEYMFAYDDLLNENSKIHKALVAKYGEPREILSGKMKWKIDSTLLVAECVENQDCQIVIEDSKFEENVEAEQKQADADKKNADAPAPKL